MVAESGKQKWRSQPTVSQRFAWTVMTRWHMLPCESVVNQGVVAWSCTFIPVKNENCTLIFKPLKMSIRKLLSQEMTIFFTSRILLQLQEVYDNQRAVA